MSYFSHNLNHTRVFSYILYYECFLHIFILLPSISKFQGNFSTQDHENLILFIYTSRFGLGMCWNMNNVLINCILKIWQTPLHLAFLLKSKTYLVHSLIKVFTLAFTCSSWRNDLCTWDRDKQGQLPYICYRMFMANLYVSIGRYRYIFR